MTTEEQTPEPGVEGSSGPPAPRPLWWRRHPILAAIVAVATVVGTTVGAFTLIWKMVDATRNDVARVEARLDAGIIAVEAGLQGDIAAAEARLNTKITEAENRLGNQIVRVESRLDRIMEILLERGGQEADALSADDRP